MAMNYTTLVAPKGTAGSLLNWVNYSKVDQYTCLDEAQSIIYQMLRVREMREQWVFGVAANQCRVALPTRFLDPIGSLFDNKGQRYAHLTEGELIGRRTFESGYSGNIGSFAFSATNGSPLVSVTIIGHGLTQGSDITIADAPTLFGITANGTRLVASVVDANSILVDCADIAIGSGTTVGGNATTYTANRLVSGTPSAWAIWNEYAEFDAAFDEATSFRLNIFRSKPLLSSNIQTNFLTDRYPRLLRVACLAAAADYMKDSAEYQKNMSLLSTLIQATNAESDLMYRGFDHGIDVP